MRNRRGPRERLIAPQAGLAREFSLDDQLEYHSGFLGFGGFGVLGLDLGPQTALSSFPLRNVEFGAPYEITSES